MEDIIAVTLGMLALMTLLSYKDERLKAISGMAWLACGMFILYDEHIIFLFISVAVGLYQLLTGVMQLYD